jgi:hypothetical protein
VIGVDTSVLVHAHREDSPIHELALAAMQRLAAAGAPWALPWPVAHEFVAVVTGKAFGRARTPMPVAIAAVSELLAQPACIPIGETDRHWAILQALAERAQLAGAAVHDARVAAICLAHGVSELWTLDRDFSRFPDLRTRNPLVLSLQEPPAPYRAHRPHGRARAAKVVV